MRFFLVILLLSISFSSLAAAEIANLEARLAESKAAVKERNWAAAYAGFKSLAEAGNPEAQFQLGTLYRNGRGVEKNFQTSVSWHTKAALAGHVRAQNYLAISLELGRGIEKDLQAASQWYLRAAQKNNLNAMHWLAKAYQEGSVIPKDFETSYVWYTLARDNDMDCGRLQFGQQEVLEQLSATQQLSAQNRIQAWRKNGRQGSP